MESKKRRKEDSRWFFISRDGVQNFPIMSDSYHLTKAINIENFFGTLELTNWDGKTIKKPDEKKKEERPSYIV